MQASPPHSVRTQRFLLSPGAFFISPREKLNATPARNPPRRSARRNHTNPTKGQPSALASSYIIVLFVVFIELCSNINPYLEVSYSARVLARLVVPSHPAIRRDEKLISIARVLGLAQHAFSRQRRELAFARLPARLCPPRRGIEPHT